MARFRIPGPLGTSARSRGATAPGPLGYDVDDFSQLWPWVTSERPAHIGAAVLPIPLLELTSSGPPSRTGSTAPRSTKSTAAAGRTDDKNKLTVEALQKVFPNADRDHLQSIVDDINVDPAAYGLGTPLRRAHFFAQIRAEAGEGLEGQVESLNYSPENLKKVFGHYRQHPDEAQSDGFERDAKTRKITRKAAEEKIANKVYANRNGNGTVLSGDGWKYRGRGLIQVTGRRNYRAVSQEYKTIYKDANLDFEQAPQKLEEFPYDLRSAICFWVMNGLPTKADRGSTDGDVDAVTAVINKLTNTYAERRAHFHAAWAALK